MNAENSMMGPENSARELKNREIERNVGTWLKVRDCSANLKAEASKNWPSKPFLSSKFS